MIIINFNKQCRNAEIEGLFMTILNRVNNHAHQPNLMSSKQYDRFQQLENAITCYSDDLQKLATQEAQLNEYIDIGLEMAKQAGSLNLHETQVHWLKRIYTTLLKTTMDALTPKPWREMCKEYLYQPLFALKYLRLNHQQPASLSQEKQRLQTLYKELSVSNRYLY